MTQSLGILGVYLASGIFTAVILYGLVKLGDLMFYGFCAGFCLIDNYLQNKYWEREGLKARDAQILNK